MGCFSDERFSDGLLQLILSHATLRDTPLVLDEFVHIAERAQRNRIHSQINTGNQSAQARENFPELVYPVDVEGIEGPVELMLEKDGPPPRRSLPQSWLLSEMLDPSQQHHLQDWLIAIGVYQRFRRLGKEAFFANKTFVMTLAQAQKLQEMKLTGLSPEYQKTALQYINSIIFTETNIQSPNVFMSLPRRISAFPHLRYLGYFLGHGGPGTFCSKGFLADTIRAIQNGVQAPTHFIDALVLMNIPVDKLQVELILCPNTGKTWNEYEAVLKSHIYPILELKAGLRARSQRSTAS